MLAVSPSEYLLFHATWRTWNTFPEIVYNILVLFFIEAMFIIRTTLLPCAVVLGSIALWVSSGTAVDIVKDSVVVTYVLELDSMFFGLVRRR